MSPDVLVCGGANWKQIAPNGPTLDGEALENLWWLVINDGALCWECWQLLLNLKETNVVVIAVISLIGSLSNTLLHCRAKAVSRSYLLDPRGLEITDPKPRESIICLNTHKLPSLKRTAWPPPGSCFAMGQCQRHEFALRLSAIM